MSGSCMNAIAILNMSVFFSLTLIDMLKAGYLSIVKQCNRCKMEKVKKWLIKDYKQQQETKRIQALAKAEKESLKRKEEAKQRAIDKAKQDKMYKDIGLPVVLFSDSESASDQSSQQLDEIQEVSDQAEESVSGISGTSQHSMIELQKSSNKLIQLSLQ